jgi:hypothetical protein
MLTRMAALLATAALVFAVLFRSQSEHRMVVSIIVTLAAIVFVVRLILIGKSAWALPFLGILGVFTPFKVSGFSHQLVSILDMATLALFAASPLILKKSTVTRPPGTA